MSYLYGDSSPSPLQVNIIELLRDVLTFSVEMLLADEEVRTLSKKEIELRGSADAEQKRIEELSRIVEKAMDGAPTGGDDTKTAHCAKAIVHAADAQVRAAVEMVRATLLAENRQLEAQTLEQRHRMLRALEVLLCKHDLPDGAWSMQLQQQGGSRYIGRVALTADCGIEALLELDVPTVARIEKIVGGPLEVHAPEAGGFFRKETKMKPQRLDRYALTELSLTDEGSWLKLRLNADGTGGGYDLTFVIREGQPPEARIARVGETGEAAPYDLLEADAPKLQQLHERISACAEEWRMSRKRVVEAKLDDLAFVEHDEPTVIVERLVEELAPTVQEVARRSKSSTELVIKQLLENKRREEIFVSKAELVAILASVPPRLRKLFAPLGLEEAKPSTRPPPPSQPQKPKRKPSLPPPKGADDTIEMTALPSSASLEVADVVVDPDEK